MRLPGTGHNDMSFEAVYDAYYDRVYKYAYTLLLNREDAEDVTADTFLAAYENYGRYDPDKGSPGTWLTRIAHNRAVNLMRSAAYSKRAELPELPDTEDAADSMSLTEDADTVLRLYARLEVGERELLDMRYVMGLKDREIGDILGIPGKTAGKRIQRLLAKCRDILEETEKAG